ncbi:MAG: hypothetical protein J6S14_10905 [Clostridia bacterium]|nr:hypothetical protein [Clostridia bacterium]
MIFLFNSVLALFVGILLGGVGLGPDTWRFWVVMAGYGTISGVLYLAFGRR